MEEELNIIDEIFMKQAERNKNSELWFEINSDDTEKLRQAIEHLIERYKELEKNAVIQTVDSLIINGIKVNLNDMIPKSKVKEKIEELNDKDLEIYDTDSEDVIMSKYEERAVLDFCNRLLEE